MKDKAIFELTSYILTNCFVITLSGAAFSVVRQARGGGGGAQRPGCQKSRLTSIDMKLCMSHYIHKSIPHAKLEADSSSSFGDMTSQNFPWKKGTSHQIRLFTSRKTGLTFKKWVFMSGIVLLDPKLTHHVNFSNFQAEEKFLIFKIFGTSP